MKILLYKMASNFVNAREPYRIQHLSLVNEFSKRGLIIAAGSYGTPPEAGLIIFNTQSSLEIEEFISRDPFNINKLITSHDIFDWNVVRSESENLPKINLLSQLT